MIEPGDRVRHRKYGLGTVMAYYPKNDGVRVEFDSGHKTVCARKRLVPMIELSETEREKVKTPSEDTRVTRSRAAGSAKVDYAELERAKKHFEELNPTAERVVPRIYGERTYVEIWAPDGTAKIEFYGDATVKRRGRKQEHVAA